MRRHATPDALRLARRAATLTRRIRRHEDCIAELSQERDDVALAAHAGGVTYEQLGTMTGMGPQNVYRLLARARTVR